MDRSSRRPEQAPRTETASVAVIGTGTIGMRHLEVLQQIPGVKAVAIPARFSRLSELQAMGYATAKHVSEVGQIGATLCIVATDTGRHVQDALSAAHNRLDVLVEKPLSADPFQAKELCLEARELNRRVFVGCILRFSEALRQFRNLLSQVGQVHSVRIECQSFLPDWRPDRPFKDSYSARAQEGGVLRDLVHEIDYTGWVFGWPESVQACVRSLGRLGIEADEAADLLWRMPNGCVVSTSLDYLSRPSRRCMRAGGERGSVEWDGISGKVTLALAGEEEKIFHFPQTREEMLRAQDMAFVETCRGTADPRLASCEDGLKALAVCDAARTASQSRREETVRYL